MISKRPGPCHLLTLTPLTPAALSPESFTILATYRDDSHLIQRLLRCTACGQRYFYEFREEIDWQGGDDPQYRTYIPVHSAAEALRISQLPPSGLASLIPRIQVDWPAGAAAPTVRRIGA